MKNILLVGGFTQSPNYLSLLTSYGQQPEFSSISEVKIKDFDALKEARTYLPIKPEASIFDKWKSGARFMNSAETYVEQDWGLVTEALSNSKNLVDLEIIDDLEGQQRTGLLTYPQKILYLKDLKISVPLTTTQFTEVVFINQAQNLPFFKNSIEKQALFPGLFSEFYSIRE